MRQRAMRSVFDVELEQEDPDGDELDEIRRKRGRRRVPNKEKIARRRSRRRNKAGARASARKRKRERRKGTVKRREKRLRDLRQKRGRGPVGSFFASNNRGLHASALMLEALEVEASKSLDDKVLDFLNSWVKTGAGLKLGPNSDTSEKRKKVGLPVHIIAKGVGVRGKELQDAIVRLNKASKTTGKAMGGVTRISLR